MPGTLNAIEPQKLDGFDPDLAVNNGAVLAHEHGVAEPQGADCLGNLANVRGI